MNAVPMETEQQAVRRLFRALLADGYRVTAGYQYCTADGLPWCRRIRFDHASKRKEYRPMHWDGAHYVASEPPAPANGKPLYRLPELLDANPAALVWIVEGEKCAENLTKLEMLATTSGSAASASGADWTPLQGRRCIVWPDHDKAGADYADAVTAALHAQGCTVELIDVEALGLPPKGDAVDWLALYPDAAAADVLALPRLAPTAPSKTTTTGAPRVILTRGSEVQPVAVDWLWQGHLAAGKFHLIGGAPGTGKTTIAAALAATVTSGGRWPDGSCAERGSVVFWSGEDDNADTLNPRLRAAGADMSRVLTVDGMAEGGDRYPFDPAHDMDALRVALVSVPDVRLIVIDPVVSAIAGDSHKNAEVRRGLQPLVDLAGELGCALLGVTHFSKGTSGRDPVERITGSLAFAALARLVMVTAKQEADGDRPERRVMLRAKSNIGPDGGGFVYELQQGQLPGHPGVMASSVLWGESIQGTARELLAEAEQQDEHGGDTASFLRDLLAYGPRSAKEIRNEAANAGYSMDAMHRAKRKIGAETGKSSMAGGWLWRLPSPEDRAEGCEGGAQNCPPSSPSSEGMPPPSGIEREVFEV